MRTIAHLDLDCFFVSCERIKAPFLIGKEVIVGGSAKARGVVSSASYEARQFGVHSAMPTARAQKLCPRAIFLPTDFDCYSYYSKKVERFLKEVAPLVEQASIDEFYLDLTGCEKLYPDWISFGALVKKYLIQNLKLPSSIAISTSKIVSKIAANEVKPNGLIYIESGKEAEFLAPLPISCMPGVGKASEREITRLGFKTLSDIQKASDATLIRSLGVWGGELKKLASGIDGRAVTVWEDPKSIGRETTFDHDLSERTYLVSVISSFAEECAAELRQYGFKARTVTVKFRLPDFTTFERSKTIRATNFEKTIFQTAEVLFSLNWKAGMKLRLVGLGVSNFEKGKTGPELFKDAEIEKKEQLFRHVDQVRAKFGLESIHLGSSLGANDR